MAGPGGLGYFPDPERERGPDRERQLSRPGTFSEIRPGYEARGAGAGGYVPDRSARPRPSSQSQVYAGAPRAARAFGGTPDPALPGGNGCLPGPIQSVARICPRQAKGPRLMPSRMTYKAAGVDIALKQ